MRVALLALFAAAATVVASPARAQPLPMGIPALCASASPKTVVAAGTSTTLTGSHGCVEVRGSATISGRLTVTTVLVYPGGSLTFADGSETTIRDTPINTSSDPEQWGNGIIVIDARVRAAGQGKTPFVRLASEPAAGATTLMLSAPVTNWRTGDEIFLPDTRNLTESQQFSATVPLQHETRTITAIGASGLTITLNAPLSFSHRGARDADGTPTVLEDGTKLLPHVANLTRSIVIRSERPKGVRGHVVVIGRADVELRGVAFRDLGRTKAIPLDSTTFAGPKVKHVGTNQVGRYPLHVHMLNGPVNPGNTGYQFKLLDNVVRDTLKWPIAIHASHYGLIQDNVVVGGAELSGGGLALEDGSETDNLIQHNFVAAITGTFNPRQSGTDFNAPGTAGECYWAAGFNNRFVENVAAGCRNPSQQVASGVGFKFFRPASSPVMQNPKFRGAELADSFQTVSVQPQRQPLLQFERNEVYGLAASGLTIWQLNTNGYDVPANVQESVVKDLTVWHAYDSAMWLYPVNKLTVENLTYRIDPSVDTKFAGHAVNSSDYRVIDLTMRGGSVHGRSVFFWDTDPVGSWRFEGVIAVTREAAYQFRTPSTPGTSAKRASGVDITVSGGRVTPWPGQPLRVAAFIHTLQHARSDTANPYRVTFENYQGSSSTFRAYFPQQGTQNLYGGRAPCQDTSRRPEVSGITCGP